MITKEDLQKELEAILCPYPEALSFLESYITYCHAIDDIIDNEEKSKDHIIQTFMLGERVFSSRFYHDYCYALYPTCLLISNTYRDSVKLEAEASKEEWKAKYADVLRHAAHDMICLVIFLTTKDSNLMHTFSMKLREVSATNP